MNFAIRPALESELPQIRALYAFEVHKGTATYEVVAPDLAEITISATVWCAPPTCVSASDERARQHLTPWASSAIELKLRDGVLRSVGSLGGEGCSAKA